MATMINYGIDLGTTNSVIARFNAGEVEIFKDPIEWKETLPSVVGFKKERILVGTKGRELLEKDPKNVVGGFKRAMGTTETFPIEVTNNALTPIELSSYLLKKLKTFVHDSSNVRSAVITIPACFDMNQSNATKEAAMMAGFEYVELLQEPIAASLAYANKSRAEKLPEGQWLVYDLGGGTFDIALVRIKNGEMKVIDHNGNNYLGGKDFDGLILEKHIVSYLEDNYEFSDLYKKMTSASGKYNRDYYCLLHLVEKAKFMLSSETSADIEFEISDENGNECGVELSISRTELENIIKEKVDETIQLTNTVITRNSLMPNDIQFVLMVGGSTFIPFVRQRVEDMLQVPVNCNIDPRTAIGVGAAHYAGTRTIKSHTKQTKSTKQETLEIKCAYQKASNDLEEFFAAKIIGDVTGLLYRITREDGGYDTGFRPLKARISEDLPLVKDTYNFFRLSVYDDQHNVVETNADIIGIAQGKYSVVGQILTSDICLELDDIENEKTTLDMFFRKNSTLPLKRTKVLVLNKTIIKDSDDEFTVSVYEGDASNTAAANLKIGNLVISGKQLKRDAMKGTDVEVTLEITESGELSVIAFIAMTGQEFKKVYEKKYRDMPLKDLREDVKSLVEKTFQELDKSSRAENYELAGRLNRIHEQAKCLQEEAGELSDDDVTDRKFQLDDRKRNIVRELDHLTHSDRFIETRKAYYDIKQKCSEILEENGNDLDKKHYNDIIKEENDFIGSQSIIKTDESIKKLTGLMYSVLWRTPSFLIGMYQNLKEDSHRFNDQTQAKSLLETGGKAIEDKSYDRLSQINSRLIDLLPKEDRGAYSNKGLKDR